MKSLKSKANTGFPGDREVLTSMVKQDLLEKMDTDLAARQKIIFCSPESQAIAARKYDSRQLCFTCLFIQAFSWCEPLSTIILVSEYLAGAMTQCSALERQDCKKHRWNEEYGCWLLCPQYFLCLIDVCLPYSDDSNRSSKCGLWLRNIFTQLC